MEKGKHARWYPATYILCIDDDKTWTAPTWKQAVSIAITNRCHLITDIKSCLTIVID